MLKLQHMNILKCMYYGTQLNAFFIFHSDQKEQERKFDRLFFLYLGSYIGNVQSFNILYSCNII